MPRPSISIPTAPHFPGNQTGSNISSVPVPGALKRKRPPTIEIPNVLCEISAQATPESASSSSCGYGFAASSSKGKKKLMEDTHKTLSFPRSVKGFFGVYDGHGGRKATEFVGENLRTNMLETIENCADDEAKEKAVKAGYLKTDREFLKQGLGSGACCLMVLIDANEIVVSNLGDCRAVLWRGGVAVALTKDHTAEEEDERKRIDSQVNELKIISEEELVKLAFQEAFKDNEEIDNSAEVVEDQSHTGLVIHMRVYDDESENLTDFLLDFDDDE